MAEKTEEQLRAEAAPSVREGAVRIVRRAKKRRLRSEELSEEERQRLEEEEAAAKALADEEMVDDEAREDAAEEEREEAEVAEEKELEIEVDDDDEEVEDDEARIEIAISSESAVERYDWMTDERYLEVLGHGQGDIDLSYARDGLPLFVDHDAREMVGLVEDIRLGADGRLRGTPRFSKSQRAREIRQDMLDGIRKKVSVGYDPGETYEQTEVDGRKVRRYRGWRPLEVSSVPIPADYEVGVGRNARPGARRPDLTPGTAAKAKEHNVSDKTGTAAAPAAGAGVDERHKELVALARQHNQMDRLGDWITGGISVDQARKELLDAIEQRSGRVIRAGGDKGPLDVNTRDFKGYSFARAIQSQLDGTACFEREVSDELYKLTGKKRSHPNAIMVSTQMLALRELQKRNMAVGNTTAGQQLRFDEPGGFLEILRNRMFVAQAGATMLSGLSSDLSFVTNPSSNTFQWGAETANATATFMGTGIKTMSPKNGAGRTNYTRQLLAQSYYAIDQIVENDLMKIIALALDRAAIVAGGGSAPVGILGTTGIGAVTLGTAGGAITSIDAWVDLETEVAVDNADVGNLAYMTTPRQRGRARKTQEFSGTNGVPIWTGGLVGEVNGYRAFATNQVPSNLTKGSNTGVLHAVIFGNWNDLVIGEWGAVELIVDPYSNKPNFIEVAAHVMADVMVRYPESFAACQEALQ
jgi:HK97 family phage major capsid protein